MKIFIDFVSNNFINFRDFEEIEDFEYIANEIAEILFRYKVQWFFTCFLNTFYPKYMISVTCTEAATGVVL